MKNKNIKLFLLFALAVYLNACEKMAAKSMGDINLLSQSGDYSLTVKNSGSGLGTITGAGKYDSGQTVTLTATPAAGSTFDGWSGDTECAANFTMPAKNINCIAAFNAIPGTPPALAAIGNNGWLTITPNPSSRYLVSQYNAGPGGAVVIADTPSLQSEPNARGYSGITVGDGQVVYFGGGHGGWPGNDVEVYNPVTNLWTQSYKPEVCLNIAAPCGAIYGGSTSPYRTPLNRPYVEQTYQKNLFNPITHKFQFHTRGTGPYVFDPVAKTLTFLPLSTSPSGVNHPWGGDIGHEHSFWAPDLADVLTVITTGGVPAGIWRQNDMSAIPPRWQLVGTWPTELTGYMAYSTYVKSQHKHLFMVVRDGKCNQPKQWRWFDPVTMTFTSVSMPGGVDAADYIEYDSKNDRLLAIQDCTNPIKLWSGTVAATPVWMPITVPAEIPSNYIAKGLDTTASMPTWQYDSVNNVFWYLHVEGAISLGNLAKLYAYRFQK